MYNLPLLLLLLLVVTMKEFFAKKIHVPNEITLSRKGSFHSNKPEFPLRREAFSTSHYVVILFLMSTLELQEVTPFV